jgi:hypothetical protein
MQLRIIAYSQSGQTARAADILVSELREEYEVAVQRIELSQDEALRGLFRMPWSFFDFLRALPASVRPAMRIPSAESACFDGDDLLLIAYPVWFLSPACPVSSYLRSLPDGALRGKPVITLSTCRNMWFKAQLEIRSLIEQKGGRVIAHVTLEDRAKPYASLVTTPLFFLTGRKTFESERLRKLFPPFGVSEEEYDALAGWARRLAAGEHADVSGFFRLNTSMMLSELLGRKIFQGLTVPWSLFQDRGERAQNVYLAFMSACMFVGIATLMPPLAIAGRVPTIRRRLEGLASQLTSAGAGSILDVLSAARRRQAASDIAA